MRLSGLLETVFNVYNQKKPLLEGLFLVNIAYHLGEGRVLKTRLRRCLSECLAYHLGEGRVLKTKLCSAWSMP